MADIESSSKIENAEIETTPTKTEIVPLGKLPAGLVVILSGALEAGIPHGSLLLSEYSRVGRDPLTFFRQCKDANIHTVVSIGKRDPPFMKEVNSYLKTKQFTNMNEMDIPRCLHGKLSLNSDCERDIMRAAGDAVCAHLDLGCNVLILSDTCQAGRLVACYSYGWTKCLMDMEELKEPLRVYVKAGADNKMLAAVKHYEYLRKYREVQEWYLRFRMDEMKKRNGGTVPNIESLSAQDQVHHHHADSSSVVLDSATEEVAAKVRAKSAETGLETKEIIQKHVRKDQDHLVWTE